MEPTLWYYDRGYTFGLRIMVRIMIKFRIAVRVKLMAVGLCLEGQG